MIFSVPTDALLYAVKGTGFAFAMTALGAAVALFSGRRASPALQRASLGFAAGIMIAASVWSLLIPSAEAAVKLGMPGWLPPAGGFAAGALFLLFMDRLLPHQHPMEASPEGPKSRLPRTALLVFAITLHNVPEGMSVGLTAALAGLTEDPAEISAAAALALGIGIQNIPEGAAVSLPLLEAGKTRGRAFFWGVMSGAAEPVFGIAAALFAGSAGPMMPWLLAFAAGAMMYVVVEELIPACSLDSHHHEGTLSVLGGFLLMMVLDTALG